MSGVSETKKWVPDHPCTMFVQTGHCDCTMNWSDTNDEKKEKKNESLTTKMLGTMLNHITWQHQHDRKQAPSDTKDPVDSLVSITGQFIFSMVKDKKELIEFAFMVFDHKWRCERFVSNANKAIKHLLKTGVMRRSSSMHKNILRHRKIMQNYYYVYEELFRTTCITLHYVRMSS